MKQKNAIFCLSDFINFTYNLKNMHAYKNFSSSHHAHILACIYK